MDFGHIIIAIWFSILTAEICWGIHLFINRMRYKSDVSTEMTFLGIILIIWCGISVFACVTIISSEHKKKIYESELAEPGIDSDGNLCLVIEIEENEDVYSDYRGDNVLEPVEERVVSHNYLNIWGNHVGAQGIWTYKVIGQGECELYKIINTPGGGTNKVIKYCVSVDEDGNIFQTEEIGESPRWLDVSPHREHGVWDIDCVTVETDDGSRKIDDEIFEPFFSNLIFLYGNNAACERPDNIDDMCKVTIRYSGFKYYHELYIDNSKNIFEVSGKGTEQEHWEVFHASPYCDMQWLYDWIDMVEAEVN
jgi:hypothetical protein